MMKRGKNTIKIIPYAIDMTPIKEMRRVCYHDFFCSQYKT